MGGTCGNIRDHQDPRLNLHNFPIAGSRICRKGYTTSYGRSRASRPAAILPVFQCTVEWPRCWVAMPIINYGLYVEQQNNCGNHRRQRPMRYLFHVGYCNPDLKHSRLFNLTVDLPRSEHSDETSIDNVIARILSLRKLLET